jgi:hypothetical protein
MLDLKKKSLKILTIFIFEKQRICDNNLFFCQDANFHHFFKMMFMTLLIVYEH